MKRVCVLMMSMLAAPVVGQDTPRDLRDMVGARAGQAEGELQRRGYQSAGGQRGDHRSYSYWWNADRRQCVTIATMDGRYDSITLSPAPDCRQRAAMPSERRDRDARGSGMAAPYDLSQRCRSEAAARWDRRPSEITVNAPIRQRNGTLMQGWFENGSRTQFFTCRFDEDDRFLSVN